MEADDGPGTATATATATGPPVGSAPPRRRLGRGGLDLSVLDALGDAEGDAASLARLAPSEVLRRSGGRLFPRARGVARTTRADVTIPQSGRRGNATTKQAARGRAQAVLGLGVALRVVAKANKRAARARSRIEGKKLWG